MVAIWLWVMEQKEQGKCSPVLEQFTVWPRPSQDCVLIIACQKALSACFLSLGEFLFGKSKRIWFKFGNSRGKTVYDYHAALWQKKFLIYLLECGECWVSSYRAMWTHKVVGAFATSAVKMPSREHCQLFSLISISHNSAWIPAQHKSTFWPSWIALWFV